jgi:diguanylate cyclase (GGDEF)-like protein
MTENQETDGEWTTDRPRGYGEPPPVAPPAAVAAVMTNAAAAKRSHVVASARRTTTTLVGAAAVLAVAVAALLSVAVFDEGGSVNAVVAGIAGVLALVAAAVLARAVLVLRRNQSTLAAREADALRMAELDELTGLGNYRMFTRQLTAEVARSRRHDDPFSLVLLDLDGFKAINDELGHLAGDDALRLVAGALRGALREEDVCCRQGGDEFAVIAVRAGEQEARELSERLTQAIAAIPLPGGSARQLGAGAGWATFGRPARSADELILRADAQLRGVKRGHGRAEHEPARPSLESRPRGRLGRGEAARLTLLSGLSRALAGAHDERALAETTVAFLAGAFDGVGAAALATDALGRPRLVALSSGAHDREGTAAALAGHDAVERALAASAAEHHDVPTAVIADELDGDWLDGTPVRCELAVAVRDEDRCWGILVLASDRVHAYGDVERTLAEAIGEQLGRALAARRLLDRLRGAGFGELYRVAGDGDAPAGNEGEQWRVADLAWRVGRALELDDADLRALYLAALFHDVGTVGVPATLLTRPGELHEEERALVREHSLIGERMLRSLPLLREAAPIVRHEHERYDGSGYPDGLAGEAIPLTARILLACDTLVAITSPRPWRAARSLDAARAELRRVAGTQLDLRVVDALLDVVDGEADEDEELSPSSVRA